MTIKPTHDGQEASLRTSDAIEKGASDAEITEAALGSCPTKPAPVPLLKGHCVLVEARPRGACSWWVGIPGYSLTSGEAEEMSDSLKVHASYVRRMNSE